MPDTQSELEQRLHALVMEHLGKLAEYQPGPVRKAGGTKEHLIRRYSADPLFSIFGLDSPEYVAATLGGGTITSIHRKIGDAYEGCVKAIFGHQLGLPLSDLTYSARIMSGATEETRTADVYVEFRKVRDRALRKLIRGFCKAELHALSSSPQVRLVGLGMEVRHCYQTGDSKRRQADEAMARHLFVSGILPFMPLFCNQSNPGIVRRYRSVWVVKEGLDAYGTISALSGFDFYGFMRRNRDDFRRPVVEMLRGLSQ